MKNFHSHTLLSFLFVLFIGHSSVSQITDSGFNLSKNLQLNAGDSLQGFDKVLNKTLALNDGFLGDEFHMFMYQRMRQFIDGKYNLILNQPPAPGGGYGGKGGQGGNFINVAPCVNEDFELNNFSGWTVTSG